SRLSCSASKATARRLAGTGRFAVTSGVRDNFRGLEPPAVEESGGRCIMPGRRSWALADVFISYSQSDRAIGDTLASSLTERGFDVWWDTELLGSQKFHEVITQQLEAAKATIVIWTPNSVQSEWVIAEAEYARKRKRLIPTRVAGFDIDKTPVQ